MPRLRQVPRDEAPEDVRRMYDMLFGDRDPVAEPGTATGTPGVPNPRGARGLIRASISPSNSICDSVW